MSDTIGTRLKHAWNVFRARDDTEEYDYRKIGISSTQSPVRPRVSRGNERSMIAAVYNRIAMDVASFNFNHVRTDQNGRYIETIDGPLNECLTIEANKDQTGRVFIQDVVMSMCDEGAVAIVPVETSISPLTSGGYTVWSMRVGKIVEWYPSHVRVEVYDDRKGLREKILVPKDIVGVIENPMYAIMNEPNSTVRRLIRKLNILDAIDEQSGSGKLDLLIQLPYTLKTTTKQKQAAERKEALEEQLSGSKYGIGYIDATERVTQLNRPTENNLMAQITYLTNMMYGQLGITEDVLNGTADERTMLNYYQRTVEPFVIVIVEEMRRKFLTKTARTQMQTIMGFSDAFKFITANEIATLADKFIRNEITTSNEIRSIIGMKPSPDPKADELNNPNMPTKDVYIDDSNKQEE